MHLYLHIPFCKQACHYCDFHFSTNLNQKSLLVDAICKEIILQQDYLQKKKLTTIYFGGGTPSLLNEYELSKLLATIAKYFTLDDAIEITLEANPDDLDVLKIKQLYQQGVNRLSIGVQSFNDSHLKFLNRVHSSQEAERCIKMAQDMGITNLSLDLIYAIPADNHTIWETDLAQAIALNIPHISAYCLTIEPQTVFGNWLKKQKIKAIDEEFASQQFEILIENLANNGLEQYEISNFAKEGWHSVHNSSYWKQEEYLGVGPSAHSFNGASRQFNVANNASYLKSIADEKIPCQIEQLSKADKVNEYLLTGLRTKWGCNIAQLEQLLGGNFNTFNPQMLTSFKANDWILIDNNSLKLTQSGKLFADKIASELFV